MFGSIFTTKMLIRVAFRKPYFDNLRRVAWLAL
jgi:hypothetical protein